MDKATHCLGGDACGAQVLKRLIHYWIPGAIRWIYKRPEFCVTSVLVLLLLPLAVSWILRVPEIATPSYCKESRGLTRDTKCSYCWDVIGSEDTTLVHIGCNNSWHHHCMMHIAESTGNGLLRCPLCRNCLDDEEITNIYGIVYRVDTVKRLTTRACKVALLSTACAMAFYLASLLGFGFGFLPFRPDPSVPITLAFIFVRLAQVIDTSNLTLRIWGWKSLWKCIGLIIVNILCLHVLRATGSGWLPLRVSKSVGGDEAMAMLGYTLVLWYLFIQGGVVPQILSLLGFLGDLMGDALQGH